MKSWNLALRRTHLYLGMLLIPWLLVYALSTVVFNHRGWFGESRPFDASWRPLWERTYEPASPLRMDDLRDAARQILAENGLPGPFGVQRQGGRLNINVQNFREPKRLIYDADRKTLRAERREFAWSELLTRLHFRVGYGQPGFLPNLWAAVVDLFCVTLLIWIVTGIYLWWKISGSRAWGFATLGAGFATIVVLLLTI